MDSTPEGTSQGAAPDRPGGTSGTAGGSGSSGGSSNHLPRKVQKRSGSVGGQQTSKAAGATKTANAGTPAKANGNAQAAGTTRVRPGAPTTAQPGTATPAAPPAAPVEAETPAAVVATPAAVPAPPAAAIGLAHVRPKRELRRRRAAWVLAGIAALGVIVAGVVHSTRTTTQPNLTPVSVHDGAAPARDIDRDVRGGGPRRRVRHRRPA